MHWPKQIWLTGIRLQRKLGWNSRVDLFRPRWLATSCILHLCKSPSLTATVEGIEIPSYLCGKVLPGPWLSFCIPTLCTPLDVPTPYIFTWLPSVKTLCFIFVDGLILRAYCKKKASPLSFFLSFISTPAPDTLCAVNTVLSLQLLYEAAKEPWGPGVLGPHLS